MTLTRAAAATTALALTTTLTGASLAGAATSAPDAEVLRVDLSQQTGSVFGGATGVLYGLSDDGVPGDDLIAGMRPRTVAQKPPDGEQHPNGDVLDIADPFFANGGEEVLVYMQDDYSRWPYQDLGIDDYLPRITEQVQEVYAAREDTDRFVWVPFNEPDGIWYQDWEGGERENFFADWSAAYARIKAVDPEARVVGPNESRWNPGRVRDFLTYAKARGELPDVMAWHELGTGSLVDYRTHHAEYRQVERDLGIDPLPINIDEYGNRQDMANPGRLAQWTAMFEATKVDADMAFWTYAGNLSDQAVQTHQGNGGWWFTKWYSDLSGDTVEVTPPSPSTPDTVQGIAALDADDQKATVLLGGTTEPVDVRVSGVDPTVFGRSVDVMLERTGFTGQEGGAMAPGVERVQRLRVARDGSVTVPVPAGDLRDGYRVTLMPAVGAAPEAPDVPFEADYEAEDGTLTDARAYVQTGDWSYAASGGADVGSMNRPTSRVDLDVSVPADGSYLMQVVYGANQEWGQHALYVDEEFVGDITYSATLGWTYRGRVDVPVTLTGGQHVVSLRTSGPGGVRPGSDITLDRVSLRDPYADEVVTPAWDARLSGDADLVHRGRARVAELGPGASAQMFLAVPETGYYDLERDQVGHGRTSVDVQVSGRSLGAQAGRVLSGPYTASSTVLLHEGVNELLVTNSGGATVGLQEVRTVRDEAADSATRRYQAEDLALGGGAAVATSRWAMGEEYVGDLGLGGTMTVPHDTGTGTYVLDVAYANAAENTGHPYNTDVITRFLDATEDGGGTTRSPYRHNYTWDGFWSVTSTLDLTTQDGDLVLGNAQEYGPNVDWVSLSPLVLSSTTSRR